MSKSYFRFMGGAFGMASGALFFGTYQPHANPVVTFFVVIVAAWIGVALATVTY